MKHLFNYAILLLSITVFTGCLTENKELTDSTVYEKVDQMPEFSGGMLEFNSYIQKHLKYPEEARKLGVEGKVFVEFVVSSSGKIEAVKVLKGIGSGCDEAAKELIASSPDWAPGLKNDKAVNVKLVLPITFKLN